MANNANNNNNNGGANRRTAANRGAAFDPRNPSLVQPYKRLVDEGFFTEMHVIFTPLGVQVTAKPDARLAALGDGMNINNEYPVGVLAALAEQGDLIPLKGKKGKNNKSGATTEQPLPAKSLCKKDFQATAAELSARAVAVANAAGGSSLIGRVRSEKSFKMNVTTSFQNWWAQANASDRASALCQPRYRGELSAEDVAKLSGLQCPFRGTAEFTVAEAEGQDEESEDEQEVKVTTTPTTGKVIGSAATAAQKARKPSPNKK